LGIALSATIFPLARVFPFLVLRAPFGCRLSCNLVGLLIHAFVRVEVDLARNELGLGNVTLRRNEILVLFYGWSRCIRGDLTGVVLCANSSHLLY